VLCEEIAVTKSTSSRSKRTSRHSQKNNNIGLWIVGIAAVIVVGVVAIVGFNSGRSSAAVTPPDLPAEWLDQSAMGNPEAAVTVQAWEDFLCPACGQWTEQVKPRLFEEYIKTGKVRFEFHHFPLQIHAPGAQLGAMAAECADDQNAFWPYHDRLFQIAQRSGQSGFTLDGLVQTAQEMGLDEREFFQCMSGQVHLPAVNDSVNQAVALGLNATPTILINGAPAADPFNYGQITAEIDQLLAAAGSQ
jgi:protein-disulfide isomerase